MGQKPDKFLSRACPGKENQVSFPCDILFYYMFTLSIPSSTTSFLFEIDSIYGLGADTLIVLQYFLYRGNNTLTFHKIFFLPGVQTP